MKNIPPELEQGTVLMLMTQAIQNVHGCDATEDDVLELFTTMLEYFKDVGARAHGVPPEPQRTNQVPPLWENSRYKKD